MEGWLIVNRYLQSSKFEEIYQWLITAAQKKGCSLRKVTNEYVLTKGIGMSENDLPEFAIFWDKDIKAARVLETMGITIFNNSGAIEICDDKSLTYIKLLNADIKMPKTYVSPLTFGLDEENKFLTEVANELEFPLVIKETKGSFGEQVYLAKDITQARHVIENMDGREYIIQEYIEYSKGRDIRINMVGENPVAAMLRENKNDFRANITNGGNMKMYTPNDKQIEMARKVCRSIGLDFAGVDIMFGEDDEPIFCEVNSNAHFKNIYDCTKINVADYIIEYVINKIKSGQIEL